MELPLPTETVSKEWEPQPSLSPEQKNADASHLENKQDAFLRGRKLALVADRHPRVRIVGKRWTRTSEYKELTAGDRIDETVDYILNSSKVVQSPDPKKANRIPRAIRGPDRRSNGADDIVVCAQDLSALDVKECERLGQDWQFLLDTDNKHIHAKQLNAMTVQQIFERAVDKRKKLQSSYYKKRKKALAKYPDQWPECMCGRHAECSRCYRTFCGKLEGDICYAEYCDQALCGRCVMMGYGLGCH